MFDRDVRPIELDASVTADLSLARMSYEPGSRRFDVTFELASGGPRAVALHRLGGRDGRGGGAAARAAAKGDIVKASDLVLERRPKNEFSSEPPRVPAEAAGMAARRAVRAGQPLRAADLAKPELVQKNDTVMLHYEVPGIVLTMRGKALDSGAEGDMVSVLNVNSKRTIQGIVTGPGRVTDRWRRTPRGSPPRLSPNEVEQPSESHVEHDRVSRSPCPRPRVGTARRLLRARPAEECRRAAGALGDREPDGAARLQAGADADADAAARDLQSELAVAQRLARVLQGPARHAGRRHHDGEGQDHRQGRDRERHQAQPRQQGGFRHHRLHRQQAV